MASSLQSDNDWREKVIVAYIEEPPFGWTDSRGVAVGCDIALADEILSLIGVETVEHREVTFAELIPGVEHGDWDINVPLFITRERAARIAFSSPVWALSDGFLVRAGNPKPLTSYEFLAADVDARLGVITGQVQHDTARAAGVPEERIVQFIQQHEAIDALIAGEIDAYASTALGNRTLAQRLGNEAIYAVSFDQTALGRLAPPQGAFSFSLANERLRSAFDKQLRVYLGSSDHRLKVGRYGLTATEIDPIVSK
jgi:polar amino acid transport system substrate-binding protein